MKHASSFIFLAVLSTACRLNVESVFEKKAKPIKSQFIDAPVNGLTYKVVGNSGKSGKTSGKGEFECSPGEIVEFEVGKAGKGLSLGKALCNDKIFIYDLEGVQQDPELATLIGGVLQTIAPPKDLETPMTIPAKIAELDFEKTGLYRDVYSIPGGDFEESLNNLATDLSTKTSLSFAPRSLDAVNEHMISVVKKSIANKAAPAAIKSGSPLAAALTSQLNEARSESNYLSPDKEDQLPDLLRDLSLNLKGSGACSGLDPHLGLNHYRKDGKLRLQVYLRDGECKDSSSFGHCYKTKIWDGGVELGNLSFDTNFSGHELSSRMHVTNGRMVGFMTAKTPKGESCVYRVNQALVNTLDPSNLKKFNDAAFSDTFTGKKFKAKGGICYTATDSLLKKIQADDELLNHIAEVQFTKEGISSGTNLTVPSGYAYTGSRLHVQAPVLSKYFMEFQTIGEPDSTSQMIGNINIGSKPGSEACLVYYETVKEDGLLSDFRDATYKRGDITCKYKDENSEADEALSAMQSSLNENFSVNYSFENHRFFADKTDITEMIQPVDDKKILVVSPDVEAQILFTFLNEQTSGNVDIIGTGDLDHVQCKFSFAENSLASDDPKPLTIGSKFYGDYKVSIDKCFKHVDTAEDYLLEKASDLVLTKLAKVTIDAGLTHVDKWALQENYSSDEQATLNFALGRESLQLVINSQNPSSGDFVIYSDSTRTEKLVACNLIVNNLKQNEEPASTKCEANESLKGVYLAYGFEDGNSNWRYLCADQSATVEIAPTQFLDIEYFGNHHNISADDFDLTCGDEKVHSSPTTHSYQTIPESGSYRHLLKLARVLNAGEKCVLSLKGGHDITSANGVLADNMKITYNVKSPGDVKISVNVSGIYWINIQANQYVDGLSKIENYSLTCNSGTYVHSLAQNSFSAANHHYSILMAQTPLPENSVCSFSIFGMKDANGNNIPPTTFDFTSP